MKYMYMVSRWGVLFATTSLILGAVLLFAPTYAPAEAAGDTLSLALTNGTTFVYGGTPAPIFIVTLVLPTRPTANYYMTASVNIDSGESFGNTVTSVSRDQLTYTFRVLTIGFTITAGNRTATASFTDPSTHQTVYSSPVSFTVTKANPTLNCVLNVAGLVSPNQPLIFTMSFENTPGPVDWQHSTYTITFKGPTTVTYSNLTPSSSDTVTVQAPSQVGVYGEAQCAFNGSTSYNPTVAATAGQLITVSKMKKLGGIQLFSSPTTLVAGQPADIYVKFNAASGLPTPTGYFGIRLGSYSTNILTLGADGSLLVHFATIPPLTGISQMVVGYEGDPYYNSAIASFPLTNPPIPGGSGNTQPTPTVGPGTPVPTTLATATPTGNTHTATPTGVSGAANQVHTSQGTGAQAGGGWLFWAFIVAIVILGGAGGVFFWVRRTRATRQLATQLDESTLPDTGTFPYWGDRDG